MNNPDILTDYGFIIKWEESTDFVRSIYCSRPLIEDLDTEIQIHCVFTVYISDSLINNENYSYDFDFCELIIINKHSNKIFKRRLKIKNIQELLDYISFYN